jgi:hypothetical protein
MGDGNFLGAKSLFGKIQLGERLGKIQKPCSQVFQLDVSKFKQPERWNPPIKIGGPPFLNGIGIGARYVGLAEEPRSLAPQ